MKILKLMKPLAAIVLMAAISLNSFFPVFAAELQQGYQGEAHQRATEDTYNVTFKSVGRGSISGPQTVKVLAGEYVSVIPTAKPFYGCRFIGWVDEDNNPVDPFTVEITENRTFTATFEVPVAVTFKAVGRGSIGGPQTVKVLAGGYVSVIPTAKPFYGCRFIGWVDESGNLVDPLTVQIAESRTFTATFEEPLAVTFKSVGKGCISGPQTVKVLNGGYVTILPTPIPFKTYEFAGWVDEDNNLVDPLLVEITKNRVFTATFEREKVQEFTVIYDPNNGILLSGIGTEMVAWNGKPVNVPTVTHAELRFAGWMDKYGLIVDPASVIITEDTIFIAQYKAIEYKDVKYDVGEGIIVSGSASEQVEVGEKPTQVPTVVHSKANFVGWVDEDGNMVDPKTVTIVKDTRFIAKYEIVEYVRVRYDAGTGFILQGSASEIVAKGGKPGSVPIVMNPFGKFVGWADKDGNIVDPTTVTITVNTTFTAKYDVKEQ